MVPPEPFGRRGQYSLSRLLVQTDTKHGHVFALGFMIKIFTLCSMLSAPCGVSVWAGEWTPEQLKGEDG
jgi:hypothetical protein